MWTGVLVLLSQFLFPSMSYLYVIIYCLNKLRTTHDTDDIPGNIQNITIVIMITLSFKDTFFLWRKQATNTSALCDYSIHNLTFYLIKRNIKFVQRENITEIRTGFGIVYVSPFLRDAKLIHRSQFLPRHWKKREIENRRSQI